MKILVAIANYGTKNDGYLSRILQEYQAMDYDIDIVVTSNISKNLGSGVEVAVGVPAKDPWSLGFAHKPIFADRAADYDLFIYSEDDMLVTKRNIEAFLNCTRILPQDEIPGFLRIEQDPSGKRYFSDVRQHFHWEAGSVCARGGETFAFFTGEHSACYLLTQDQLKRAILSGGFLSSPNEGRHDLLVTAATDPYTRCGFRKMICISRLEDFALSHLSNKYAGTCILSAEEFYQQISILPKVGKNGKPKGTLVPVETKLYHEHWSKDYYEPVQAELADLVPPTARNVLSVGCGWGETEKELIRRGMDVTGIPIDSVVAVNAEARGVHIVYGDVQTAIRKIEGQKFDCIVFSNILHLAPDPVEFLKSFNGLVSEVGAVVASVPHLPLGRRVSRRMRLKGLAANPESYEKSRMHLTTARILRKWFKDAGLKPTKTTFEVLEHPKRETDRLLGGFLKPWLASNVYVYAVLEPKLH